MVPPAQVAKQEMEDPTGQEASAVEQASPRCEAEEHQQRMTNSATTAERAGSLAAKKGFEAQTLSEITAPSS